MSASEILLLAAVGAAMTGLGCSRSHGRGADAAAALDGDRADVALPDVDAGSGCLPPADPEAVGLYLERLRAAWCRRIEACGLDAPWPSIEECAALADEPIDIVEQQHRPHPARFARGELAFDPEAARRCVAHLESCGSLTEHKTRDPVPCSGVFLARCGAVVGQACTEPGECGEELDCRLIDSREPCRFGTCQPFAEPGESCAEVGCRPPRGSEPYATSCQDIEPSMGFDLRCVFVDVGPSAADGEPCRFVEVTPAGTWVHVPCDGLCAGGGEGEPDTCRTYREAGQACDEGPAWCRPQLECVSGECAERPRSRFGRLGDSCGAASDPWCEGLIGRRCLAGVCVEAGGAVGQPCDLRRWPREQYCEPPLFCNEFEDRCEMGGFALGADCDYDAACASGCCEASGDGTFPTCQESEACQPRWCGE